MTPLTYNRKVCLSPEHVQVARSDGARFLNSPKRCTEHGRYRHGEGQPDLILLGIQGEQDSPCQNAAGEHSKLSIKQGDLVIISSNPIPGNEKYVSEVINMLYRGGANVIYSGMARVHVSGHACQEELKLMLALTKPKYFIPVHGEYRHIYNHARLAESLGMKKQNVFISELGREIILDERSASFGDTVPSGVVM